MKKFHILPIIVAVGITAACNQPKSTHQSANATKVDVKNNNVEIAYTDTGTGDTTLLFVHGWAINKGYFTDQVKHFAGRYRVVTMDMPGFGKSGKNRDKWNTKTYATDVNALIDQLKLKNVVLAGHSMAGDIVLQAAINQPDKVIAIIGIDNFKGIGWVLTEKDRKEVADAVAEMSKHYTSFATMYFNDYLFSKTTSRAIKDRILYDVAHTDSVIATKAMAEGNGENHEVENLRKYNKKLYLINSDYQPTDTTTIIAKKIPYKLMNIHGAGHFPMVEAPEDFNKAMDVILKEI
ncbi:alpha/beta hydrolase [Mucilaginibacter terrenus]|uniref:Alpha/beta hydrolase n=1 Tax=Mucilaginibacter terrenus TaxID=2482727 RepID=A0A3E2NTG1_9SPHI|nr:alpha/beta hydrolase [Mucilaginibacter terrenus]RFZ84296.1 alpha/beta hydrolase [Mucilaginibacter terrenus]